MTDDKFQIALEKIKNLIQEVKFEGYTPFLTQDDKTLQIEGDKLTDGAAVLLGGNPGAKTAATDGTYNLQDGNAIEVRDGKIVKVIPVEPTPDPEPTPEPALEFSEEALADGGSIFIEPTEAGDWMGGRVYTVGEDGLRTDTLVPDGEYILASGVTVTVAEGVVTNVTEPEPEMTPEVAAIAEQVAGFEAQIAELKRVNEEKDTQIGNLTQVTEKTLEIVTELAALPAVDSPQKKRGIRKDVKKGREKLHSTLQKMNANN